VHAALRSKRKYWLARNQDNVSVWSDMGCFRRLALERSNQARWFSTKGDIIIISLNVTCPRHDIAEKLLI